ncbi:hypothetical protein CEE44_02550 [Candidatus Woesearchaeota archaeon B3_Woes]|nr:MAG: hypothetical protein CEE44_02550 [Candidatus Woesearchaeota archaeon B3_Woes]
MKIEINIKKKHLYYLTGLVCLLLIGLVIADGFPTGGAYHDPVYTNTITSRTDANSVKIDDDLEITGGLVGNLNIAGDLDVEGTLDFGGAVKSTTGEWVTAYKGDFAVDVTKETTDELGTHKFCFLSYVGLDEVENMNNEEYSCQVDGEFNGEWTLKTLAQNDGGYDGAIKCGATCVD